MRPGTAARPTRITTRNATFQQWQSFLTNRTKRHRARALVVQGVRPITVAVEQGWPVLALVGDGRPAPSAWAADLWARVEADHVVMAPELLRELGGKPDAVPELLAVVEMPPDDLARLTVGTGRRDPLVTVFDRPSSPGNVGTLARSVDAFGGTGLVVTGHAADPWDPAAVRASTGSVFAVPVVRTPSHVEVLDWVGERRSTGTPLVVVGTDEHGDTDVRDADLSGPVVLVVGNETAGMTTAWRDACDVLLRIPMGGSASSLNAATAGSVVLWEAMRQRSA